MPHDPTIIVSAGYPTFGVRSGAPVGDMSHLEAALETSQEAYRIAAPGLNAFARHSSFTTGR